MNSQEIFDLLKDKFGDSIISILIDEPSDSFINVQPDKILEISLTLRDNSQTKFDYLMCISGVDSGDNFDVVYHLYSTEIKHKIVIKSSVPREKPMIQSVERVWRSADWHEREAFDMFGIHFEGHHNLIRILCPYDWEGFPLRKDYKEPDYYHGMKVPY